MDYFKVRFCKTIIASIVCSLLMFGLRYSNLGLNNYTDIRIMAVVFSVIFVLFQGYELWMSRLGIPFDEMYYQENFLVMGIYIVLGLIACLVLPSDIVLTYAFCPLAVFFILEIVSSTYISIILVGAILFLEVLAVGVVGEFAKRRQNRELEELQRLETLEGLYGYDEFDEAEEYFNDNPLE